MSEERQTKDKNPWGTEAHMESLRAMACKRIYEYTGVDQIADGTADQPQAFVAGLRLAAHVLRHLIGTHDVHDEEAARAWGYRGLDLIEDIANAAEDGREPGAEESADA